MEQDLIQDAAEHIAVAGGGRSHLDSFTDGAAEGAGRVGIPCENGAADVRGVRRAGRDACAIGAHDLAAEGLLLIRALDHEDLQVKAQIRASHGKGCAPLPGARLGRNALEALLLGIVRLRDSGVQFVTSGCIVALKFVIDFRRGAEFFFQTVCAHQRRRTVHLVKVTNFLRNGNIRRVIVQFLLDQFVAEDRAQIVKAHGLAGAGVHGRRGFIFHVCANIIPILGHLRLRQIDLVRNVFGFHGCFSFRMLVSPGEGQQKRPSSTEKTGFGLISWDKSLKTSAVPPKLTISCPLMTRLHASSPVTVGLRQRLLAYTFSLPSAAHSANVFLLPSHQPATL